MSELTKAGAADRHRELSSTFLTLTDGVSDWDAPTPVPEWKARDIVEHLSWLPGMLQGMGVTLEVPPSDDPVQQFRAQTQVVQARMDSPQGEEQVQTNIFGVMPFNDVIDRFYNFDLYAHAWDLAKASGQDVELDADFAAQAHEGMCAMGPMLQESGQFGTPQPVADDASPQEKLLALIGRDVHWTP